MRGLTLLVVVTLILSTGCAGLTELEMANFTQQCEKETTIVIEPARTVVVEACVKERVDEEREYRRVTRDAEFLAEFYRQARMCEAAGGQMIITRTFMRAGCMRFGRTCPPEFGDHYGCQGHGEFY